MEVTRTVDKKEITFVCQIILKSMCCSLWFCLLFLMEKADVLVIHDTAHKIVKLHHEDEIPEVQGD